jgi:TolB-like protein/Tfp pilus assembly protein PilF
MQTIRPPNLCETCGSSLDIEAPNGFCPACLLTTALHEDGDTTQSVAPGTRIEDYELLDEVARGGMGIVYRARQRTPSRIVALKMILPAHLGSSGALDRFCAEAQAAASLDHEGILPIYAVGEHDGAPFYSMKFAEGGTLRAKLPDYRDKLREGAALIAQIARAVAHAHEHGILHRDLKPDNILFDATGKSYVSDFGLAKWLEREGDLTQTLAILGTPFYMAPEQAAGAQRLTPAADVYSLGAILFHLLTDRVPFRGDNALDVLRQAAERPAPRPRALNNQVPADLETICLKCLEKNPAARYSFATALADDLDRFLARRPISARRANPITHAVRWTRRNPTIALLGAASAALLVSLLLVMRPTPPEKSVAAEKSIAVLPFENLGTDKTNEFFASGMHEDVLVSLSRIADLKVISRNSVMQYRGIGRDLREIGRALGVSALLEGTVRREGNRARINVQLIKTADGAQIWAENYDRDIKDAFAIQSEVALRIASALRARLSSLETARLQAAPTKNSEAYLRFIEAKNLYSDYRKLQPDLDKAERLYQEAIALDSGFALAYARLSQLHNIYYELYDTTPARREKARAAAHEALRLQPDLPEGHLALALDYWRPNSNTGEIDYERALTEFWIAQRGLPNDAEICGFIAQVERHQGKWPESTGHLKKAISLDPNSVERWHRLFYNYELTRNYTAAAAALEHTIALSPQEDRWTYEWHRSFLNFFRNGDLSEIERVPPPPPNDVGRSHTEEMFGFKMLLRKYDEAEKLLLSDSRDIFWWGNMHGAPKSLLLGRVYSRSGQRDKARAQFEAARVFLEQAIAARPRDADAHINLAEAYAGLGRKNDAILAARRATEIIPESKDPWYGAAELSDLAQIYVTVGEFDLALPIIEHCLSTVSPIYRSQLRFQPAWDPVRNDPRFQELIARSDVVIPVGEKETPPPSENADNKSIAVLPFENLSEDKSNDYLASGIHDELLVDLSKIADLKVISRNSVQAYKDGPRDLREIGRALGVRTVLQGNVRTAGNKARISVQLLDTRNEAQIWAESFDREITDVLSVESELALRIAAALQTKLSPSERAAIEALPTRDPEAYDLYLRARESVYSIRTRDDSSVDIHRAIDLLNQAVGRDPNFALAYSFLAQMHLSDFQSNEEPAQLERARICLETALRLAPDLGDAHLARGIYFNYGLRDYERARAEFAIARSALPNNAECLHWSGLLERRVGHWKEGLHYQLKAATLDPRDGMVQRDLLVTYCLLRNYTEAERTIERAIIVSPQQTSFFRMKQAEVALMKGDLTACRTALQSLPSDFEFNGFVAYLRARLAFFERDYAQTARVLDDALNKLGRPKAEWWVLRDRAFLARAEGDLNKTTAAWEDLRKFWEAQLAAKPDDWQLLSWIAAADAALGRKEEAKRGLEKAAQHAPTNDSEDGPTLAMTQALVNAWCGDHERALAQLAELVKKPAGPKPGDLKFDPRWDDLRGDPRFQEIAAAAAKPIKLD